MVDFVVAEDATLVELENDSAIVDTAAIAVNFSQGLYSLPGASYRGSVCSSSSSWSSSARSSGDAVFGLDVFPTTG